MENQNQNSRFTEVGGSARGTSFDPRATEKNGMRFMPGPHNCLEGYFHSIKHIPSSKKRDANGNPQIVTIFKIQIVNQDRSLGEIFDLMGDTILNDRLASIPLGSYVRVEYQGRKHKEGYATTMGWTQTNSYHMWYIGMDPNAIPMQAAIQQFGIKMPPPAHEQQQNQGQVQNFNQGQPQQGQNFNQYQGQQQGQPFGQPQQGQQQWPAQGNGQWNPNQVQQQGQPTWNPNQNQGTAGGTNVFQQHNQQAAAGQSFVHPQQGTSVPAAAPVQQGQVFNAGNHQQQAPAQHTHQGAPQSSPNPPAQQGQTFGGSGNNPMDRPPF